MSFTIEIAHANDVLCGQWRVVEIVDSFGAACDALQAPAFDVQRGIFARIINCSSSADHTEYIYGQDGWRGLNLSRMWKDSNSPRLMISYCNQVPRIYFIHFGIKILELMKPYIPEVEGYVVEAIRLLQENNQDNILEFTQHIEGLHDVFGWEFNIREILMIAKYPKYIEYVEMACAAFVSIYANDPDHIDDENSRSDANAVVCYQIRQCIPLYEITSRL